jgi:sulfur-carrier protein adenylyltransferase/sulfurtransferase
MAVTILIPTPLRPYVDGRDALELEGGSVGELLERLAGEHAGLKRHLFADDGRLRSFVNVYVNDRDIRQLSQRDTLVKPGDTVSIIPSIAGGTGSRTGTGSRGGTGGTAVAEELPKLSHEEILRYSRHLILPDVGVEGQRRLKAARVLLVGAGGLGSPAALYLAAAGVGTLGIVDFDVVDKTNLQRQVLHGTSTVGVPKLESARERIQDLNPNVNVEGFETRLTSENALDIIREFDIVADGTDNFPTRYLVNDACVLLGKPNVYGSIFRFEGQASVFHAQRGPCYRCLYSEPPPPGLVPSCAEGGVLGVLPGIVGSIQAMETLKLILGVGEPLIGRLLLFDALRLQFRELKLEKDPDCPVCGEHPTISELIDYEAFCGMGAEPAYEGAEIGAVELRDEWRRNPDLLVLDVRDRHEHEIVHLEGAVLVPLSELPDRLGELDGHKEIVTHCHHGARSLKALEILRAAGFSKVRSLRGGIDAWAVNVDPSLPRY